jgi:type VI secretion system secreted protein VgrG
MTKTPKDDSMQSVDKSAAEEALEVGSGGASNDPLPVHIDAEGRGAAPQTRGIVNPIPQKKVEDASARSIKGLPDTGIIGGIAGGGLGSSVAGNAAGERTAGLVGGIAGGIAGAGLSSLAGELGADKAATVASSVGALAGGLVGGIAGADLGGVAGKVPSPVNREDLPIFEERAITSSTAGEAVTSLHGQGGAFGKAGGAITGHLRGKNLEVEVASGDALDVRQFLVNERLSSLFQVSLIVVSENASIDFDAVVGQPARFVVHAGAQDRFWSGLCNDFEQVRVEPSGMSTYQISITPTLWLLTQRKNYRIFQHISEPDIVLQVLKDWNIEPDVRIDRGAYKKRKYRVQYAESDFAFISRMLEDAGITYYFEQSGDETKLVLSDAPQGNPRRERSLSFMDDTSAAGSVDTEAVTGLRMRQRVRPGKYTVRDHDYRRPPSYKLMSVASGGRGVEERLERYHYRPGAFLFGTDQGDSTPAADDKGKARTDEKEAAILTQKRLDAKRGNARLCTFETNAHDLAPGAVISVAGHPHEALGESRTLLIVESSLNGADDGEWSHHCEARGTEIPFRPEMATPRPTVKGVESATVVGPPGEEIHTDEFGRVRVHFHWDRESKMDDNSSCWIHVSHPWSGAGYGGINLPRVGQEVLVDFLGGDPDRPVIVGRVYTNLQKVPYKLPDNKTQSGWKSNSTGNSGGYNEIMFEDAAGRELVNIQAQKDLNKLVKNNEAETTGVNQTITVGNNRTAVIGAVDSALVGKQHSVTIAQPPDPPPQIPPTGTAMSDKNVSQTTGQSTLAMSGPDVNLTAAGNISISAGANISMSAGANIQINAGATIQTSAGILITNTAGVQIITTAGAIVQVKAGAMASVEAAAVLVKGDTVEVTASGPVDINGAVIDLN